MTATSYPRPPQFPPASEAPTRSLLVEVIAPEGLTLPQLPGWTVTVWPLARLGDFTLEARPLAPTPPAVLLGALRAAGFTPLGLRERR